MTFRFEDYVLDPERRELRYRNQPRHLEPQVFDLLAYLVKNRARLVGKDELIEAIAPGRFVSDGLLSKRLNTARYAIGDNGQEQRLIQTFRRRGLRFIGTVTEEKTTASRARPHLAELLRHPILAAAVCMSGDLNEGEHVLDEISNAIILGIASLT